MTPRTVVLLVCFAAMFAGSAAAQTNPPSLPQKILLPDGPKVENTQDRERKAAQQAAAREAARKADYESNVKDAARIRQLAKEIEPEVKDSGAAARPPASIGKLDEIEKLSKGIRKRLRRLMTT